MLPKISHSESKSIKWRHVGTGAATLNKTCLDFSAVKDALLITSRCVLCMGNTTQTQAEHKLTNGGCKC